MKKRFFLFILIFFTRNLFPQQNVFFIDLSKKDLATFNDGITLIRLFYNEIDYNASFLNNIIWAADKKLFQVTIPIKPDQVNPVLTRGDFAYWICKVFNTIGGLVNTPNLTKLTAYKTCLKLGILNEGRGPFDNFSGSELLDTFGYSDYYIKTYKIRTKAGSLEVFEDYKNEAIPEWRQKFDKELDEQRAREKDLFDQKKKIQNEKLKPEIKNKNEKYID